MTHAELRDVLPVGKKCNFGRSKCRAFFRTPEDTTSPPCVLQGQRREWVETALLGRDAHVLVCNLFAMPVVIRLGEKLEVPVVCLCPFLYNCPDGLAEEVRGEYPEISFRQEFKDWF